MQLFFKNKVEELLFIAITLLAFIVFYTETDIFTPSFPQMITYFNTDEDTLEKLLSMNFLGICVTALFFGPASDSFGRKKVLCTGLFIFMTGSLGCALTESLDWMIAFRFWQGMGCGAIVSAGLTSFFDIYEPEKSSRLISVLNGTLGGLMALAPMVGNWINIYFGWRANFYLIATLAVITFLCNLLFMRETLPKAKRVSLNPSTVFHNYFALLSNIPFMAANIIWCLMFSMVLVFIANLSLIFIDYLDVSQEVFGYYQSAIMGAFFAGSMLAAMFIKQYGCYKTKMAGSISFMIGILLLALFSYNATPLPLLFVISMALASFGCALACTLYLTDSMAYINEHLKGAAMSLTQSLRLCLSAGLIWVAANAFDGSTKPMSLLGLACLGVCIVLYIAGSLVKKASPVAKTPHQPQQLQ